MPTWWGNNFGATAQNRRQSALSSSTPGAQTQSFWSSLGSMAGTLFGGDSDTDRASTTNMNNSAANAGVNLGKPPEASPTPPPASTWDDFVGGIGDAFSNVISAGGNGPPTTVPGGVNDPRPGGPRDPDKPGGPDPVVDPKEESPSVTPGETPIQAPNNNADLINQYFDDLLKEQSGTWNQQMGNFMRRAAINSNRLGFTIGGGGSTTMAGAAVGNAALQFGQQQRDLKLRKIDALINQNNADRVFNEDQRRWDKTFAYNEGRDQYNSALSLIDNYTNYDAAPGSQKMGFDEYVDMIEGSSGQDLNGDGKLGGMYKGDSAEDESGTWDGSNIAQSADPNAPGGINSNVFPKAPAGANAQKALSTNGKIGYGPTMPGLFGGEIETPPEWQNNKSVVVIDGQIYRIPPLVLNAGTNMELEIDQSAGGIAEIEKRSKEAITELGGKVYPPFMMTELHLFAVKYWRENNKPPSKSQMVSHLKNVGLENYFA